MVLRKNRQKDLSFPESLKEIRRRGLKAPFKQVVGKATLFENII